MPGTISSVLGRRLLLRTCDLCHITCRIRPGFLFKELAKKEKNITCECHSFLHCSFHKWASATCLPDTIRGIDYVPAPSCRRCTEQGILIKWDGGLERGSVGRLRREDRKVTVTSSLNSILKISNQSCREKRRHRPNTQTLYSIFRLFF